MKRSSRLRLFWRFSGLAAPILLAVAMLLTVITMVVGREARRLADDGVTVEAAVLDKWTRVRRDSDGDRRTDHYLELEWRVDGTLRTSVASVARGLWRDLQPGDTTELRYWRPDPDVNEVPPGVTETALWFLRPMAAIPLAISGFFFLRGWRRATETVRVIDAGRPRPARVTEHVDTKIRVNGQRLVRVAWADDDGIAGRSDPMHREKAAAFPPGAEISVYVDPAGRIAPVWAEDVRT